MRVSFWVARAIKILFLSPFFTDLIHAGWHFHTRLAQLCGFELMICTFSWLWRWLTLEATVWCGGQKLDTQKFLGNFLPHQSLPPGRRGQWDPIGSDWKHKKVHHLAPRLERLIYENLSAKREKWWWRRTPGNLHVPRVTWNCLKNVWRHLISY